MFITADFKTWVCQNVSKEVLLTGSKIQVKVPSRSDWLPFGRGSVVRPSANSEGLKVYSA